MDGVNSRDRPIRIYGEEKDDTLAEAKSRLEKLDAVRAKRGGLGDLGDALSLDEAHIRDGTVLSLSIEAQQPATKAEEALWDTLTRLRHCDRRALS